MSPTVTVSLDRGGGSDTVRSRFTPVEDTDVTLRRPVRPEDQNPRLWHADGWTARVVKNIDDDGWAVEMTQDGESEPSLVGPWTMGRDKKNPKPLDQTAFATLVKTVTEVLQRHAHQRRAMLHRSTTVPRPDGAVRVDLDVVPDEDDPHAYLSAWDEAGERIAKVRVMPNWKLTPESARRWVDRDYKEP